jgi:hypothetical protein
MPGRVLALIDSDDDFVGTAGAVETVRDVSGDLVALLARCSAAAIVVRPDRYVYRVVEERELRESLAAAGAPQGAQPTPWQVSALSSAEP